MISGPGPQPGGPGMGPDGPNLNDFEIDLLRQLERQSGVHDFDLLVNVIMMMRDMDPESLEMISDIGPNALQELIDAAGKFYFIYEIPLFPYSCSSMFPIGLFLSFVDCL